MPLYEYLNDKDERNIVNHAMFLKMFESLNKKEIMFDEETGEVIENKDTKHIKESLTDPESGCFHKGEKEKCFAYTSSSFLR